MTKKAATSRTKRLDERCAVHVIDVHVKDVINTGGQVFVGLGERR